MMKKLILLGFALLLWVFVFAGNGTHFQADNLLQKKDQLFFIENKGQWHSDVLYLCRMGKLDAWITKYGVNYIFYKIEKDPAKQSMEENDILNRKFKSEQENEILLGHRVLLKYENHNPNPATEGSQKQSGYYNYFIGNDAGKHATKVGLYKEVMVKDVYHGIDIRYYFDRGCLRYDYFVQPGADPGQIKFELTGAYDEYLKAGDLCYTTRFGEVLIAELKSLQENKEVASRFVRTGKIWQLQLGTYNTAKPLIIDPLLYSTYIGGGGTDHGYSIAIDASGNAYITGYTESTNYDISPGAFQTTYGGGYGDAFVTKLNSTGTAMLYSTFIGGSTFERGYGIAIDASCNSYIAGYTSSTDYDITSGAFQTTYGGGDSDVFVTKLNSTGTALLYSTYVGGSADDECSSIALDASGNAYITGETESTNYDITTGAFQTTYNGDGDVFVTKLNSNGTALLYSTYIGGSGIDVGSGIALDASDNAYITGRTYSTNYDITTGAFQTTSNGPSDVFVTKLNSTGAALLYSTYIGGSGLDNGTAVALDASGNAYITGVTKSADYDITTGAFQTTHGGGVSDAFITKLNSNGTALLYSTYIGGGSDDAGSAIALDASGNANITGYTGSADYDITAGAIQTTNAGNYDVFVTKLNSNGNALIYSTYIGGFVADFGSSIALNASGIAWITGRTGSPDYDITSSAFQQTFGGCSDVFVTKLALCLEAPAQPSAISGNATPCEAATETYSVTLVDGVIYTWTLPTDWTQTGGGTTNAITVTVGAGSGNITVTPSNGCGIGTAQTFAVVPTPLPAQPGAITGSTAPCEGTSQSYSITNVTGVTYTWTFPAGWTQTGGGTTNTVTVTVGANSGEITVTPSIACGNGTAQSLDVAPALLPAKPSAISGNATPCDAETETYTVTIVDSVTYTWTFPADWTQTGGGNTNSVTVTVGIEIGNITVTPSNGCGNGTAQTLAVMPTTLPAQPGTITGSTTPCQGSSQSYSITNVTGVTYTWTFPTDWTQTGGGNTNSVTVTVGVESGNITVTPSNGCGNGTAQTLAVMPAPLPAQPGAITGLTAPCEGTSQSYSITNVTGVTYAWTFPAGWTQTGGGTTNTVTVTVGTESGIITVTPSNECGNGGSSLALNVTPASIPPTPTITYHGDTLTSSAAAGNHWHKDGVAISGATGQSYITTEIGTYTVIVTINGCSSEESATFIITSITNNMNELNTLLIQPNPNAGKFKLTADVAKRQICTLEIITNTGVTILREEGLVVDGNFSKEVDITGTPTGVYMVVLRNAENQVIRKLIVTH